MRGASFFTRQSRVSASLKSYYRAGLKVPFSHGWPPAYCGTARRPGAVLSRESRSLVAGARANSKSHRTALKLRSHLSRAPPETSDRRAQERLARPACLDCLQQMSSLQRAHA